MYFVTLDNVVFYFFFCLVILVEGLHGNAKVRAVNLGGWLVVEGWIKPSLFDDIPNGDMLVCSLYALESS